jgi:hypothetical protein
MMDVSGLATVGAMGRAGDALVLDGRRHRLTPLLEVPSSTYQRIDLFLKFVVNVTIIAGAERATRVAKDIRGIVDCFWTASIIYSGSLQKDLKAGFIRTSAKVTSNFFAGASYSVNLLVQPILIMHNHKVLARVASRIGLGSIAAPRLSAGVVWLGAAAVDLTSKADFAKAIFDGIDAAQLLRKPAADSTDLDKMVATARLVVCAVDAAALAATAYAFTNIKVGLALVSVGLSVFKICATDIAKARRAEAATKTH